MIILTVRKAMAHWRYDPDNILSKLRIASASKDGSWWQRQQIERSGLLPFFQRMKSTPAAVEYNLFASVHKQYDSLNLFRHIQKRSIHNVVEFGCGVSTLVMAYALQSLRRRGKVFAVEADAKWAKVVEDQAEALGIGDRIEIIAGPPHVEDFLGQTVCSFPVLPDVRPDLIYVDGPDPNQFVGSHKGITGKGVGFPMLKDPLNYEWSLYADAVIILDGRYNNFRFLQENLKRKYRIKRRLLARINEFYLVR